MIEDNLNSHPVSESVIYMSVFRGAHISRQAKVSYDKQETARFVDSKDGDDDRSDREGWRRRRRQDTYDKTDQLPVSICHYDGGHHWVGMAISKLAKLETINSFCERVLFIFDTLIINLSGVGRI